MIATRYLHRSDVFLHVGDEILSPRVLAGSGAAWDDVRSFANWQCYVDAQYDNVYFSMDGSRAAEILYAYPHLKFTYVVEPLGPVEPDPEDKLSGVLWPSGSLRCERAKIVESYTNAPQGPRLENGFMYRFGVLRWLCRKD